MDVPTTKVGVDGEIDQFTKNFIRKKARQLIGKTGFTSSDRDEIEADLTFKLLKNLDAFDCRPRPLERISSPRSSNAALPTSCETNRPKSAIIVAICSLNVVIAKKNKRMIELGDSISSQEQDARLCRNQRSNLDLAQLLQDLNEVFADLPPELRELAEAMKTDSITAISRDKGIPRYTLNYRVRQLRQRFEEAGLAEYIVIIFVNLMVGRVG